MWYSAGYASDDAGQNGLCPLFPYYDVSYRRSSVWDDWDRVERVGWLDSIQMNQVVRGDIILFRNSRSVAADCKHIAVFLAWEGVNVKGDRMFSVMDSDSAEGSDETIYKLKNIHDVYTWVDDVPGEDNLPIFHD